MTKIEKAMSECEEWLATTTEEWTPIAMQKAHCRRVFQRYGIADADKYITKIINQ